MKDDTQYSVTTSPVANINYVLPKKRAFLDKQSATLPKLHTLCVAAARRGGGKTVTITNMLRGYKAENLCDRVFLISPTAVSNAEMFEELVASEDVYPPTNKSVLQIIEEINGIAAEFNDANELIDIYKAWRKFVAGTRRIESLTQEQLYEFESSGVMHMEQQPVAPKRPVLHIVVDDCQATEIMRANSPLTNLCIRHRHLGNGLGASVWLLVQSYLSTASVPRCIRENCILLLLWNVRDEKLRLQIASEATGVNTSVDEFLAAYDFAVSGESGHDFLLIDYSAPRREQFRRNLNERICLHKL